MENLSEQGASRDKFNPVFEGMADLALSSFFCGECENAKWSEGL
jgi:hypothetical protein